MSDTYADIIIDISHEALDRVFEYRVPPNLCNDISVGDLVEIPFGAGNRRKEGYVVGLHEKPVYHPDKMKEIGRRLSERVSVHSDLIKVAYYLKNYYGGPMAQALRTVLPVKTKVKPRMEVTVHREITAEQARQMCQEHQKKHRTMKARLMDALAASEDLPKEYLVKEQKVPLKELRACEKEGILSLREKVVYRNPFGDLIQREEKKRLNEEQQIAVNEFVSDFQSGACLNYLLFGVTGSGKTEVYLAMIDHVIEEGRQAIVLIPEISLTYQTVRRFARRYGERIAVIHSRMSAGEKSDALARIEHGDVDVVIGARSALFAPLSRLGLIIIDEEHDSAYKSEHTPKYHARETALYRALISEASVVMGSATPSVESFYKAEQGIYKMLRLTKRAGNAVLPKAEIVDLREEFRKGSHSVFSGRLLEEMRICLKKKEQIVLFLNRRGYAGFVSCRSCGEVMKCPHCDVSMTYHRGERLRCHYCGYELAFTGICPACGSPHVAGFGLGTEKVEAALHKEFPKARIIRMDADTTKRKNAHAQMLQTFAQGKADILLGTQMIVKGHDYPNVTLAGILAADLSLNENNYRSGETTFQLLCQAEGRAGRGDKTGKVIIQTYQPDHYAIVTSAAQDYEQFYRQEIAYRQLMNYPPAAHMLAVLVMSADESQAALGMQRIGQMVVRSQKGSRNPAQVLSPGVAKISKIKDVYRYILYVKHEEEHVLTDLQNRLEPVLSHHPMFAGLMIQYDMDPMSLY